MSTDKLHECLYTPHRVLRLLDALEDLDDVQDVYANFDISDDVMAEVS
jgi:transcriptional/translational regulatory protein YebC/TACO1